MRNLHELDRYRVMDASVIELYGSIGDETCGVFRILSPIDGKLLTIIASSGMGWDHVSVSRYKRTPNWLEMSFVHRLFFKPEEYAMELHVPEGEHVNLHPNCLHLWRPTDGTIPVPPSIMVGPKNKTGVSK